MPATIKARRPAFEDGDQQSVTGIAFKTEDGKKYNNIACLSTSKQATIRDCEDWLVVWDEDKCPAMFPPEIVTTSRRTLKKKMFNLKCQHLSKTYIIMLHRHVLFLKKVSLFLWDNSLGVR